MKKLQSGFTLIELVVVIVILGILAATAIPKFVDVSSDAKTAAAKGVAGGIISGSAIAFATSKISGQSAYTSACNTNYLTSAPTNCTVTGSAPNCSVTCDGGSPVTFTIP